MFRLSPVLTLLFVLPRCSWLFDSDLDPNESECCSICIERHPCQEIHVGTAMGTLCLSSGHEYSFGAKHVLHEYINN